MDRGGKQGTVGKKRKKKPKKEGVKSTKAKGTSSPTQRKKAPIPLAIPLAKCDDCSSGSSLDQQPQLKQRKTRSHQSSTENVVTQKDGSTPMDLHSESFTSQMSQASSQDTQTSSRYGDKSDDSVTNVPKSSSLRWEGKLPDQEQERQRIECYKAERRQRYQELLAEQRDHSLNQAIRTSVYQSV